jgi:hypothetical protein
MVMSVKDFELPRSRGEGKLDEEKRVDAIKATRGETLAGGRGEWSEEDGEGEEERAELKV